MKNSLTDLIQEIFDQELFIKKYEEDELLEIPFDEDLFFWKYIVKWKEK